MGKRKKELEDKLDKITHIYRFVLDVYRYVEYMHKPKTKEEFELIRNSIHSNNLQFIMHSMFRVLIVELAKLYSDSNQDKYRLRKLLDSLKPEGRFQVINFPKADLDLWESKIEKNKNAIKSIKTLRNKFYAHSDFSFYFTEEFNIDLYEIKSLVELAEDIIQKISSFVFDVDYDYSSSPYFDEKRFFILSLLAKAEQMRKNDLVEKAVSAMNKIK